MSREEQRARLIEILSQPIFPKIGVDPAEVVADYLLDNGVIVPPCKVGDTVYYVIDLGNIVHGQVLEIKVLRIEITDEMRFYSETVHTWFGSADFGKTVFFTREEAEKALAERSES